MPGNISKRYSVSCGYCRHGEALLSTSYEACRKEARELGWRLTIAEGWLCPGCVRSRAFKVTEDKGNG